MSIYDIVAAEDVEILKSTLTEKCAERHLDNNEFLQGNTIDLFVHLDKGGAKKEAGHHSNEFVKLSGYFAKWSHVSSTNSKGCCDEQCLPRK